MHHGGGLGLTSVPSSANQRHLDLNLSQKASQNPFKGHDEPERGFKAPTCSHPESTQKAAARVLTTTVNGCLSPAGEREHTHGSVAARPAPNEPSQNPIAVAEDELPAVNEPVARLSVGRKRKSHRVEASANAQKELLQSGSAALEDGSTPRDGPMPVSPGPKRKSARVKQTNDDLAKKVILALEANEDEGLPKPRGRPPRGSSDLAKDVFAGTPRSRSKSLVTVKSETPDLAERRLLLEERKLRLAEQRFALEEKKLEATIEIGKGLIISMEHMTHTISSMASSSSLH